jgi:hypothetical protein
MSEGVIEAKALLVHYFKRAFQGGGLHWNSDNQAEVEQAVDLIISAAVAQSQSSGERQ